MPYFVFDHFNLGPLTIYVWGLMVGLGFAAGYFLLHYLAEKKNLETKKFFWLSLVIFSGGVLGSRLAFLLQTPREFLSNISLLWNPGAGSIFLGGLVGAVFFGWLYIRLVKLDFWTIADLLVLPLTLGISIGRIGCFLINDHQGAITSLPWGILWPDGFLRHPVALYESLAGFIFFIIFWRLKDNFKRPGQLSLLFLASYSVIKFFLDFTRQQQGFLADAHFWKFDTSQWLAIFIFLIALVLWQKKKKAN
jgi:phosphatidylglycerol:prolipoprotein diacylglycerol transferase